MKSKYLKTLYYVFIVIAFISCNAEPVENNLKYVLKKIYREGKL